ncbi:hypothetical protein C8Q74DRAFT_307655 [Fomes fomentarius]|nr:hypothetical protein C8Q74DRAFT_307655 [Fomes fomentarius]
MAVQHNPPSACIQDLAVELLERIFSYACSDGGYTGRSLSLVSRLVREVVQSIRFRSVALAGCTQIQSFLVCLEKERLRAHSLPAVYHLFLSTWADGQEVVMVRNGHASQRNHPHCYQPATFAVTSQWCAWMTLQEAMDKKFSQLLPRLLQMVAADLRTLSIVHSWEFGAIQLPPTFPSLRDLTFCGPPPNFPGWCTEVLAPPPPCFPSLQHLHLVRWKVSIVFWVYHAPKTNYLRLSDLSSSANMLASELQCTLGLLDPTTPRSTRRFLRHVRLQTCLPQGTCGKVTDIEWHSSFIWQLKKMQTCTDVQLELMQARRYRDGYWAERIKNDWLRNIVRGPGWWSGGEEQEDEHEAGSSGCRE